ncbi:MAG: NUDIX domain-containing protein [Firmicutes bacterium]|nr:NUDIX domain-containing protein [Bacillota bacterium]
MKSMEVALALIQEEDRWFLQRRDLRAELFPGLWELPGGKVERGERPEEAMVRELHEELRWMPVSLNAWPPVTLEDQQYRRTFHLFRCAGQPRPSTPLAWGWFTWEEMRRLPMPPLNAVLLGRLSRAATLEW